MVGLKKQSREKYSTKASPGAEKKKKIQPLERILKTEESCKRYWDLEALQKAQKQKERQMCPAGVPGSHPTCRQGQADSHVPSQVGAGSRRCAEMRSGGSGSGFSAAAAALGGSTVPSAVRMLLFQQCRQETIQGNDYYIILKEYGLEEAEAAPSHVLPGDRSPGLHGNAALWPWARDSRGALGLGAGTSAA